MIHDVECFMIVNNISKMKLEKKSKKNLISIYLSVQQKQIKDTEFLHIFISTKNLKINLTILLNLLKKKFKIKCYIETLTLMVGDIEYDNN